MTDKERIVTPLQYKEESLEEENEFSLRPKTFKDFIGQENIKNNLSIFLEAAKKRNETLEHVLLTGPPGLGKTTLAHIIANESKAKIITTSGPSLEKTHDIARLLTNLKDNDVLFIDEIHRLKNTIEEFLYPAMEDCKIDIILETGTDAKSIEIPLKRFTLVGATTRSGMLTSPLRDRFGHVFRMKNYAINELEKIISRSANLLESKLSPKASTLIANRCRATPRIANRILRRCRDVSQVKGDGTITTEISKKTLTMLGIDNLGLDQMDITILTTLIDNFSGHPVGLSTLSAAINEEKHTIEEVYEPFLIQQGLLQRTPKGRMATLKSYRHLNLPIPSSIEQSNQQSLLEK